MLPKPLNTLLGLVAIAVLFAFIFGLAHSISSGFAGFWGGLPFWIISIFVMSMAAYDFWDSCLKNKSE